MPDASPRSVKRSSSLDVPSNFHDSQSWGSATAAIFSALLASLSATQRTLLAVNDATSDEPTACAIAALPPTSSLRVVACVAERVSFQRSAGRITFPSESKRTIPCCWPPIAMAATSDSPPACAIASLRALHHFSGSTSVPSGCAARPSRISSPVSALRITIFTDCVDESTPATS